MAALIRWNPIRELAAMERMMDAMAHRTLRPTDTATGALALDVSEADNVYTVTTALPGVKADDIQIHLKDGVLTISAEIPQRVNERKDGERVLLRERVWGKFSRSVRLPDTVNGDAVEAVYEDGVLTLTLPKAEAALPRTIAVKALKG
jgi:HSP20 family protein